MKVELSVSLTCDIGCVRTINEDMILISGEKYRDTCDDFSTIICNNGRFVAAVADGMGGHNAGEIASEMALDCFDNFIVNLYDNLNDKDFRYKLDSEIKEIHRGLTMQGNTNSNYYGMGTTLVSLLTFGNRFYLLNVGDSRAYRFRNGILCQITTDHSVRNKNKDYTLPSNMIYNCLGGGGENAFADVIELTGKVFENDVFLLCSDGLYDELSEEEIETTLKNFCNASSLVNFAKAKGGHDNISAIVITIKKCD